jgi:hypothetical protein
MARRDRVAQAIPDGPVDDILRLAPGKRLLEVAAREGGMPIDAFVELVTDGVAGRRAEEDEGRDFPQTIVDALTPYLPDRRVSPVGTA